MTGAASVGIARNIVSVQTVPVSQDCSTIWGMVLFGDPVQTTVAITIIMEGIDPIDETVVVVVGLHTAEAAEVTETIMTTTIF